MSDNIQIELTNGEVLEIDEFDLDALALQAKHRKWQRLYYCLLSTCCNALSFVSWLTLTRAAKR